MFRRAGLVIALLLTVGCGDDPTDPSSSNNNSGSGGSSNSGCFAIVGNKGTITATISGLAAFNGTIPNGSVTRVTGGPVPIYTIGAVNTQDGTGVIISGQGVVGTSAVGPNTVNTTAASNSISVQTRSCTASTGTWFASIAYGTGSITVTSYSATSVSGNFSATLDPVAGSGTRTISGTFNATF